MRRDPAPFDAAKATLKKVLAE